MSSGCQPIWLGTPPHPPTPILAVQKTSLLPLGADVGSAMSMTTPHGRRNIGQQKNTGQLKEHLLLTQGTCSYLSFYNPGWGRC